MSDKVLVKRELLERTLKSLELAVDWETTGRGRPPSQTGDQERDDLRAALAQQEVAMLVAVVDANDDGYWADILPNCSVKVGDKLYAHPPAQQETSNAPVAHVLYRNGDNDIPASICDRDGQVVLSMCKVCGKAEIELSEPCEKTPAPQEQDGTLTNEGTIPTPPAQQAQAIPNEFKNAVCTAITMLFHTHPDDTLRKFSRADLKLVLDNTLQLSDMQVEDVYRAAFDVLIRQAALHPSAPHAEASQ